MTTATPAQGFLSALEAWAESVRDKIVAVAEAFLPTLENDLEIALEDLAAIAGQAVLAQATAVISGNEKFGAAVTDVIQTVEASGKTVLTQTAQSAVQQAYTVIKTVANTPAS